MSNKHTPGPWSAHEGVIEGDWFIICSHSTKNKGYVAKLAATNELSEEDARLIAAAPELLRLLIEAQRTLKMWEDVAPAVSLVAEIEYCIAKARGEE